MVPSGQSHVYGENYVHLNIN